MNLSNKLLESLSSMQEGKLKDQLADVEDALLKKGCTEAEVKKIYDYAEVSKTITELLSSKRSTADIVKVIEPMIKS